MLKGAFKLKTSILEFDLNGQSGPAGGKTKYPYLAALHERGRIFSQAPLTY